MGIIHVNKKGKGMGSKGCKCTVTLEMAKQIVQAAEDEGTQITYLSAPQEVLTRDGKVIGLRCIRMELSEPDSSGRKRPIPIPGSEYDIEIDQLIPAIGQRPDLSALEDVTGLTFSRWGTTEVDAVTFATEREGVFAGGDLQTGPWVAIGAIGAGKEAAESILRYIEGRDLAAGREPIVYEDPCYMPIPENQPKKARASVNTPMNHATNMHAFSSDHSGGANFLYADGSVHFLAETIDSNSGGLAMLSSIPGWIS